MAKDTIKNYKYLKFVGFSIIILFALLMNFLSVNAGEFMVRLLPKEDLANCIYYSIMFGFMLGIFPLFKREKTVIGINIKKDNE
jgi:hypothetical protein